MSRDIKTDQSPQKLIRRAEPDDLGAQVKALKELQQQPGFMVRKPAKKKDNGLYLRSIEAYWYWF